MARLRGLIKEANCKGSFRQAQHIEKGFLSLERLSIQHYGVVYTVGLMPKH
jgi:prolipoprotein diacylglyceryltransferase